MTTLSLTQYNSAKKDKETETKQPKTIQILLDLNTKLLSIVNELLQLSCRTYSNE